MNKEQLEYKNKKFKEYELQDGDLETKDMEDFEDILFIDIIDGNFMFIDNHLNIHVIDPTKIKRFKLSEREIRNYKPTFE